MALPGGGQPRHGHIFPPGTGRFGPSPAGGRPLTEPSAPTGPPRRQSLTGGFGSAAWPVPLESAGSLLRGLLRVRSPRRGSADRPVPPRCGSAAPVIVIRALVGQGSHRFSRPHPLAPTDQFLGSSRYQLQLEVGELIPDRVGHFDQLRIGKRRHLLGQTPLGEWGVWWSGRARVGDRPGIGGKRAREEGFLDGGGRAFGEPRWGMWGRLALTLLRSDRSRRRRGWAQARRGRTQAGLEPAPPTGTRRDGIPRLRRSRQLASRRHYPI